MPKEYIKGTVRQIDSAEGKKIIKVSINVLQLQDFMNDKGYANISLLESGSVDEYGNTHFIIAD